MARISPGRTPVGGLDETPDGACHVAQVRPCADSTQQAVAALQRPLLLVQLTTDTQGEGTPGPLSARHVQTGSSASALQ
jgi:hypothetical protein